MTLPDFYYKSSSLPSFDYEDRLHKKGFSKIAGADEVGRGCFAGPIVAGCVVFSKGVLSEARPIRRPLGLRALNGTPSASATPHYLPRIDDSKKLTARQREIADKWIKTHALAWGIGEVGVATINKIGIKKATEMAFRKAIKKVNPDYLLMDAFYIPYVKGLRRKNQTPIVHGDARSFSIASASIIAKVYRDSFMAKLSKGKYRKYGWAKNKGYGTKEHQKAILKYGPSKLHREAYVQTWLKNSV